MALQLAVAMTASIITARPARAQTGEGIAAIGIAGYLVLGYASVARLIEGSRPMQVGDSVRLVARDRSDRTEHRGRITAITADSLTLLTNDAHETLAMNAVPHIDAYVGRESKWAQGWAFGGLGGGALGGVAGFAQGNDRSGCDICLDARTKALLLGVFGGVSGSVVGALIGAATDGDHWRPAQTRRGPRVAARVMFAPVVGRANGLAARISF
jgi:hypothetical protein